MKIGMNLLLWTGSVTEEHIPLLKQIKKWGFDGVELPMFDPKGAWSTLSMALDDLGLGRTAVSVMPPGGNLIGETKKERKIGLDHLKACVDACVELGAEGLCGPIYSPVGRLVGRGPNEQEWGWCAEGLRALGEHANPTRVTIGVEALNRFETYFLNSQDQLSKMIDEVNQPSIKQMYDTFHANIEEKDITKAVKRGGKRISHVHISANDRATPGEDHINYKETFAALKGIKYPGWLTIESFGHRIPELAGATCIWRQMAPSEEHIAKKGLKFIRQMLGTK